MSDEEIINALFETHKLLGVEVNYIQGLKNGTFRLPLESLERKQTIETHQRIVAEKQTEFMELHQAYLDRMIIAAI